jgi:hypothetical protein
MREGLTMKLKLIGLIISQALLVGFMTQPSAATTLTYDDIGVPNTAINGPFVEQGFQFSGTPDQPSILDLSPSATWGLSGPAYSGNYAAIGFVGVGAAITRVGGGTFSFDSTQMKGWYTLYNGILSTGVIIGYLNGLPVSAGVPFSAGDAWVQIVTNFSNVDTVVISTTSNNAFLLDDSQLTATPLPSTWLMLLSGFVGLGFFAYRGTKKNSAAIAAA